MYVPDAYLLREAARIRVQIVSVCSPGMPFRIELQASRLNAFALTARRPDIEEAPAGQGVARFSARLVHLDARFVAGLGCDLADAMNGSDPRQPFMQEFYRRPRLHRLMQLVVKIRVNALLCLWRKGVVGVLPGQRRWSLG